MAVGPSAPPIMPIEAAASAGKASAKAADKCNEYTNLRGSAQKQRFRACDKRLKVGHCAYTYKYKAGVNAGLNADIKEIEQAAV